MSFPSAIIMKKFELFLFVFIAVFLIPLFISLKTIDPGLLPRFMILALLLLLLQLVAVVRIIKYGLKERCTILISAFHLFLGGYVIFSIISLSKAINIGEGLFEVLKVMLFATYIIIAAGIVGRSEEVRITIIKSIMVTSFLVALLGIAEYWGVLQLIDCVEDVAPASTMGNRNLLSSFLFLCSGFVLFGVWRFSGLWYCISLFTCSAIIYVFIITQTRAVWVACTAGVIVTGAISLVADRYRAVGFVRHNWRRILSVVVIGVFLVVIHHQFRAKSDIMPEMSERLTSVVDTGFRTNRQRLKLWEKTFRMIRENVILGVGAGHWKVMLPKYGLWGLSWQDMATVEVRPYNDFLWVFAETGIFGFACFLGIFAIGGVYAVRSLRNIKDRANRPLSACLLFILVGYTIVSFFDFPKERIAHLLYWGTVLSFIISINRPSLAERRISAKAILVAHCTAILLSVVCLSVGYIRVKGDLHMINVINARRAGRWKQVIAEADSINTVLYPMDHTSTPVYWYRGVANFSLDRIQAALHDFQKAYAVHPHHIHVLNNLGSCYEVLHDHLQAEQCYLKVLEIAPGFDNTLVNLAVIYYNMKDYNRAYATIMRPRNLCDRDRDPRRESYIKAIEAKLKNGGKP